jgi:hypothetical protein
MYGLKCDEKTGLPWVVCDGADNEKTKEYSSKEPMQRMTFQACNVTPLAARCDPPRMQGCGARCVYVGSCKNARVFGREGGGGMGLCLGNA